MNVVLNETGVPISYGTVVADLLPDGWTVVRLTPEETTTLKNGGAWDGETVTLPIPQPPEPSPEEKLAAVTARLDKLAPVRSEHDVPADPTYLPPATDLRTPR